MMMLASRKRKRGKEEERGKQEKRGEEKDHL